MGERLDLSAWQESFAQASADVWTRLEGVLASVAMGGLIIAAGWVLAIVASRLSGYAWRAVGLDRVVFRLVPPAVFERAGSRLAPSQALSQVVFWLVFLVFGLLSIETLGVTAVTAAVDEVVSYLPNLLRAFLVLLFGLLLSRFLGGVVISLGVAGGAPKASRLGFLTQLFVSGLVVVLAVQQLGLAPGVLVAPFTALVATVGFATGLAFALGAQPIITHILAGHFLRRSLPRDVFVEVNGQRGVVERIGATDTLLRGEERAWSVPNGRLLDEIVVR